MLTIVRVFVFLRDVRAFPRNLIANRLAPNDGRLALPTKNFKLKTTIRRDPFVRFKFKYAVTQLKVPEVVLRPPYEATEASQAKLGARRMLLLLGRSFPFEATTTLD